MIIWIISPYGPVPGEGWRDHRFTMLGRALAARGHTVAWWTASFAHQFKAQRPLSQPSVDVEPGFSIRFVRTPAYTRNVGFGRLLFEAVFAFRVWQQARTLITRERPDWVLAGEPPKLGGVVARWLAKRSNGRFAVDVLDLWPELWVTSAPRWLRPLVWLGSRPLVALRRSLLQDADIVFAVNETYRRAANANGARGALTAYIGVDASQVGKAAVPEIAVASPVIAVYAGSLGVNYDIPALLTAVRLMHTRSPRIHFVVAGDGPLASMVREAADVLPNLTFLGRLSVPELNALYARAHIALAPYGVASTVALPVKLFDYLAAGLPIISSLPGEMAGLLSRHHVGTTYVAGDAESLVRVMLGLAGDGRGLSVMAANARQLASTFDAAQQYERVADAMESKPCL